MISSIQTVENKNTSPFGNVTKKVIPSDFWLPIEDKVEIRGKQDGAEQNQDSKVALKSLIVTPDEARKTNNIKTIGLSIAGAVVLTAAVSYFLLKGGTKGLTKNFEKVRDLLERKILTAKLRNNGKLGFLEVGYAYLFKFFDNLVNKSEAVNNFTSFKDMLFKKIMFVSKPLGKLHDKITRLFERLGRRTVVASYQDTLGLVKETGLMTDSIATKVLKGVSDEIVEIGGVKRTKAEWMSEANRKTKEFQSVYETNFDSTKLTSRYLRIKKSAEKLKDKFANFKTFLTKDLFMNFLAESTIMAEKADIQNSVHNVRKTLSFSKQDLAKESEAVIYKMIGAVPFKDTRHLKQIRTLDTKIKNFTIDNPDVNVTKGELLEDIAKLKLSIQQSMSEKAVNSNSSGNLLAQLDELNAVIANYKKGKAEEILDIYKHILDQDDYNLFRRSYKNTIESLDKSINLETEEFFSKVRDLVIGSAPTDVLTMIGPLGVLGYQLGKSDDREQRESILLKYGFPAIAGIGVSLYCNAKLYAGTKSLLFAFGSSALLNRIGVWGDDMLKKYIHNKPQNNEQQNQEPKNIANKDQVNLKEEEPLKLKNPPKIV